MSRGSGGGGIRTLGRPCGRQRFSRPRRNGRNAASQLESASRGNTGGNESRPSVVRPIGNGARQGCSHGRLSHKGAVSGEPPIAHRAPHGQGPVRPSRGECYSHDPTLAERRHIGRLGAVGRPGSDRRPPGSRGRRNRARVREAIRLEEPVAMDRQAARRVNRRREQQESGIFHAEARGECSLDERC
jgi:hypothetical protein